MNTQNEKRKQKRWFDVIPVDGLTLSSLCDDVHFNAWRRPTRTPPSIWSGGDGTVLAVTSARLMGDQKDNSAQLFMDQEADLSGFGRWASLLGELCASVPRVCCELPPDNDTAYVDHFDICAVFAWSSS